MAIEQYLVPQSKANICFDCQKACGGCSWSEIDPNTGRPRFEPVPGWTAKKVKQRVNTYKVCWEDTYHITACPEFVPDEKRAVVHLGEISEEQMRLLLQSWKRRGEL